jgi:uncharacterized repeat protein (TIGR01451 family)
LTVAAPANGALTNVATVSSPTLDTNLLNNTSPPVTTAVTPVADVIVTADGPTNVLAGGTIVYTITLTNSGPSTASNVVVNDNLPTNSIFVTTTGGGTNTNGIVTWPVIPVLTNGGSFDGSVNRAVDQHRLRHFADGRSKSGEQRRHEPGGHGHHDRHALG